MKFTGQKILLPFFILLGILSCTPTSPYELRSPCVAAYNDNAYGLYPCVRRPLNTPGAKPIMITQYKPATAETVFN